MPKVRVELTRGCPARELHAGSGYWSHDGVVQVLGLAAPPTAVWVRWPGGAETETPLAPGARAITIDIRGAALTAR